MKKILIICGPTAAGKTSLALHLANKFAGELVSADSRQVYQGMDIGTGKDLPPNSEFRIQNSKLKIKDETYIYGYYLVKGIRIWLLDLARPNQKFSVAHYQQIANQTINDIWQRNKLPIVVGGTGFYIKALLEPIETIQIPPDPLLRKNLNNKSVAELQMILKKTNYSRWKQMNESDRYNPRRLIRAIEIAKFMKKNKLIKIKKREEKDILLIGLKTSRKELYQRIDRRVDDRVKKNIIGEIKALLKKGYSWDLAALNTLGYRQWQPYFEGKISKEEAIQKWKYDEHAYARRQLTWFKKMKGIHWIDINDANFIDKAEKLVSSWYN